MTTDPAERGPLPGHGTEPVDDRGEVRFRVLSVKAIWWAAGLIVVVGVGVAVWLLLAFGRGGEQARNQLEAIKTAGTIVVGAGGAAALLLAARRQRSAEIALKQKDHDQAHQEQAAADTREDAAERRITELYTKAADQLGSEKAPVRLAGLYALERVAQNNSDQRQTIVNVLCAYLRMPYQLPGAPPAEDADQPRVVEYWERMQEREVRLAAQRLLATHLRPGKDPDHPLDTFWPNLDLDHTAAVLVDLDLGRCCVRTATFIDTQFIGTTWSSSAQFSGDAWFDEARFHGTAVFDEAYFGRTAAFHEARFSDQAGFIGARFSGDAWFHQAQFLGTTRFGEAHFNGTVDFGEAHFNGDADFDGAQFSGETQFDMVRFGRGVPAGVARFVPSPQGEGEGTKPAESKLPGNATHPATTHDDTDTAG